MNKSEILQDKKKYYTLKEITSSYFNYRYGGKSGRVVNQRELETAAGLIPKEGVILDIPCGTGRFLSAIGSDYKKYGLDYSQEMLDLITERDITKIKSDAFHPDLPDAMFDSIVSLRFVFHYADIAPFFKQVNRLLKPGGVFVCQNYRWSPLSLNIPVPLKIGGKIYAHSDKKMRDLFETTGFRVEGKKTIFLFSPFVYRFLPLWFVRILYKIEKYLPERLLLDNYWKAVKK